MASLLLDLQNWDLCLDANGNLALASEPYSFAQDAACHMRLIQGELTYDTTQGIPYFQQILGHWPAPSVLRAYLTSAAVQATGVDAAQMFFTGWKERQVTGVVNVESETNPPVTIPFSTFAPVSATGD